jgi:hypothetical protein
MFTGIKRFYSRVEGLIGFISLKNEKTMSVGSVLERQARKRPENH